MRLHIAVVATLAAYSGWAFAAEWTSGSRAGDGSVFSFREHRIGDPIEAHRNTYWGTGTTSTWEPCVSDADLPGLTNCTDYSMPRSVAYYRIGEDLAVKALYYRYFDGKLIGFRLVAPHHQFDKLSAMLVGRYGEPNERATQAVKNRAGAAHVDIQICVGCLFFG